MSFNHKISIAYQDGASAVTSELVSVVDEAEVAYEDTVVAGASDVEADISFPFAGVKACCLVSDKDVTVKTNSSSTPGDTITLTANKPLIWYDGARGVNPFTADVTKLFFSNAGGSIANVKVHVLLHVTA